MDRITIGGESAHVLAEQVVVEVKSGVHADEAIWQALGAVRPPVSDEYGSDYGAAWREYFALQEEFKCLCERVAFRVGVKFWV